jgi:hypothetical protein
MRKTSLLFVAAAVAVSTFAMSKEAHALGPLSLEIGANVGYGSNPDGSNPINPLGVGIGGRAGVGILGFYGGLDGEYYFGGSQSIAAVNVKENTAKYGVQLGYSVGIPFLTIRPQLGIGNATFSASSDATTIGGVSVPAQSSSKSSLYLEPGVVGLLTFGMYFVGADINGLLFTSYPTGTDSSGKDTTGFKASFTAHGQIGVTF